MAQDNSDPVSKVVLRKWLLNELGGAPSTSVLELYGGLGSIHDACYTDVKKHMAFELRKVNRPTWLQGDNRTLLRSHVQGWDLYDLDAYASPWQLANDICRLRQPGRFAMALTCGTNRPFCSGNVIPFIRQRIGLGSVGLKSEGHAGLFYRWYFDIVKLLMLDWRQHGVQIVKAKHIDSTATNWINYFGVIVEKTGPAQPVKLATPKHKMKVTFPKKHAHA